MKSGALSVLLMVTVLSWLPAIAEEGPDDARTHLIRGEAAIEMAKSPSDLQLAVDEFKRATELDPHSSPAWYNLGSVQAKLGRFDAAIQSYKQYLALEPKAADAQKVRDEIIKLEFRQEQISKAKKRSGTWVTNAGTHIQIAADGNRMILTPSPHKGNPDYIWNGNGKHMIIIAPPRRVIVALNSTDEVIQPEEFRLVSAGSQLSGSWITKGDTSLCKIPEESGDVTGKIDDDDGAIELHFSLTIFHIDLTAPLLGDPTCNVTVAGKHHVDLTLTRP